LDGIPKGERYWPVGLNTEADIFATQPGESNTFLTSRAVYLFYGCIASGFIAMFLDLFTSMFLCFGMVNGSL